MHVSAHVALSGRSTWTDTTCGRSRESTTRRRAERKGRRARLLYLDSAITAFTPMHDDIYKMHSDMHNDMHNDMHTDMHTDMHRHAVVCTAISTTP